MGRAVVVAVAFAAAAAGATCGTRRAMVLAVAVVAVAMCFFCGVLVCRGHVSLSLSCRGHVVVAVAVAMGLNDDGAPATVERAGKGNGKGTGKGMGCEICGGDHHAARCPLEDEDAWYPTGMG